MHDSEQDIIRDIFGINEIQICTQQDSFLEDKAIWMAFVRHKQHDFEFKVYQDDNRNGMEEPVAWKRLWQFCKSTGCYIHRLRIKFRSNSEEVPFNNNNSGCYFSYGSSKDINSDDTCDYYVVGFLHKDKNSSSGKRIVKNDETIGQIHYAWYSLPELEIEKLSNREAQYKDVIEKRLILSS